MGIKKKLEIFYLKDKILMLFFVGIAFFVFSNSIYEQWMPKYLESLNVSVTKIGFFFTVASISTAIVAIPAGWISDRIERKYLIILTTIGTCISIYLYTVINTIVGIYLVKAFNGVMCGFLYPVSRAYLMDNTTAENRGRAMSLYLLLANISMIISPTAGGFAIQNTNENFMILFYIGIVFSLISILILVISTRSSGKGFSVSKMRLPTKSLLYNKNFVFVLSMFSLLYFANGILVPVTILFVTDTLGAEYSVYGLYLSLFMIIYSISQFASGGISDRYGRKKILVYSLILYFIGVLIGGISINYPMFFTVYILVAIGVASYTPVGYSLLGDTVEKDLRGVANGAVTTLQSVGMMVGPLVGGFISDRYGYRPAFFASAVVIVSVILLSIYFLKGEKK